jgi:hypothetical protein
MAEVSLYGDLNGEYVTAEVTATQRYGDAAFPVSPAWGRARALAALVLSGWRCQVSVMMRS